MRRKLTVTAASVITAVALGFGVPAIAQDDGSSGTPDEGSTADGSVEREGEHAERRAELAGRLADELGIEADRVEAALEKVGTEMREEMAAERLTAMEERLAAAVEDGRLTQEQADSILEAMESGTFRSEGRGGHARHGGPGLGGPFGGPGGAPDAPGGAGELPADPSASTT